jgi:hypothetical protein
MRGLKLGKLVVDKIKKVDIFIKDLEVRINE